MSFVEGVQQEAFVDSGRPESYLADLDLVAAAAQPDAAAVAGREAALGENYRELTAPASTGCGNAALRPDYFLWLSTQVGRPGPNVTNQRNGEQ